MTKQKQKTPATYLYTGWNEDQSRYIHDEEREIYVGMPCTFGVGSDSYPAFVTRISDTGKSVWIKRANYEPDKENGYDYFSNQVHIITPNDGAMEERVTKNKWNQWRLVGAYGVYFGTARAYQDPHF